MLSDPVFLRCKAHPVRRLRDGRVVRFSPDAYGNLFAEITREDGEVWAFCLTFKEMSESVDAGGEG